jgi:hypothetical protein
MLEERYRQEAWIRIFTDGTATRAVWRGGAGVHINFPDGQNHLEVVSTGLRCIRFIKELTTKTKKKKKKTEKLCRLLFNLHYI